MAKGTAVVMCRNLTQGQLTAVLFVRSMAVKAARGDRFATNFMALAAKRQCEALAALASLLSNADAAPSPSDFRYALPRNPRNALVLGLKICCALLALIVIAAASLWASEGGGLSVRAGSAASATAAPPEKIGPEHPAVATDLDNLIGLLRAMNGLAKAEPLKRRPLAIGKKSLEPRHTEDAADLDDLAGVLRALAILELERRTGHEAHSGDNRELLHEMGMSNAEIEAALEALSEPVRPRP